MFGPLLPLLIPIIQVTFTFTSLLVVGVLLAEVAPKYARVYFFFLVLVFVLVGECLKKH
jgi:hypothetical protein